MISGLKRVQKHTFCLSMRSDRSYRASEWKRSSGHTFQSSAWHLNSRLTSRSTDSHFGHNSGTFCPNSRHYCKGYYRVVFAVNSLATTLSPNTIDNQSFSSDDRRRAETTRGHWNRQLRQVRNCRQLRSQLIDFSIRIEIKIVAKLVV